MEAEITLKHPVKSPDTGAEIARVCLREAKAGDLFAVAKLRDATQEERSNAGAPNFPSRSSAEDT